MCVNVELFFKKKLSYLIFVSRVFPLGNLVGGTSSPLPLAEVGEGEFCQFSVGEGEKCVFTNLYDKNTKYNDLLHAIYAMKSYLTTILS